MIRATIHALILAALLASSVAFAAQSPRPGPLDRRVTEITYRANDVVRINATYGISTMIIFGDDEKFETIALGDTESWQVVPTDKGNILFVKPVAKNASTNLNVVTSKRIYYFELFDHDRAEEKKVFGIRFAFPENLVDDALRKEAEMRASYPNISNIDRANINIDYSFSGNAILRPIKVFDDGTKTFFEFGKRVPAIFGVNSDYTETLKNFRKEGEYIVVDGVSAQFTLRDGSNHICIFNLGRPDYGALDPYIEAPVKDPLARKRKASGNNKSVSK